MRCLPGGGCVSSPTSSSNVRVASLGCEIGRWGRLAFANVLANRPNSTRICPLTSSLFCDFAMSSKMLFIRAGGLLPLVPPLTGSWNVGSSGEPLLRLR
jgi:hypothetical protein